MKLIYLHIPKNAGTSLHGILEANFSPFRTFSFHRPREDSHRRLLSLGTDAINKLDLIKGHWPFGLHELWEGHEATYITLLREPSARLVSEYRYVLRNPKVTPHRHLKDGKLSIRDALAKGILRSNEQTRWLLSPDYVRSNTPLHLSDGERAFEQFLSTGGLFGLVEKFDQSLLLFGQNLGWKHLEYARQNVSPAGPSDAGELSKADQDAIAEATTVDQHLFKLVSDHWEAQWASFSNENPTALEHFRSEMKIHQSRLKRAHKFRYMYARAVWRLLCRW